MCLLCCSKYVLFFVIYFWGALAGLQICLSIPAVSCILKEEHLENPGHLPANLPP